MPTVSPKQGKFMRAVAHNPEFSAKTGVPQSVGKEFVAADKAVGKKRMRDLYRGKGQKD